MNTIHKIKDSLGGQFTTYKAIGCIHCGFISRIPSADPLPDVCPNCGKADWNGLILPRYKIKK